jgi:hypothetical protein
MNVKRIFENGHYVVYVNPNVTPSFRVVDKTIPKVVAHFYDEKRAIEYAKSERKVCLGKRKEWIKWAN